jgi:hypothetical protein
VSRSNFFTLFAAIALGGSAAYAADVSSPGGGVLAQIFDGGGAHTTVTLTNLDNTTASYTLNFYHDDGTPLTLITTAGTNSSLAGALPVNGSIIIQTNGPTTVPLVQGYAVLVTNNTIAGTAAFAFIFGGELVQATCPLDTSQDWVFGIPFDNSVPGNTTGIAVGNAYGYSPLNINIVGYDQNGNQIAPPTIKVMQEGTHTAFAVTDLSPAFATAKGTLWFTGTDSGGNPAYFNVLSLAANNFSLTFTSVVPIVPQGF